MPANSISRPAGDVRGAARRDRRVPGRHELHAAPLERLGAAEVRVAHVDALAADLVRQLDDRDDRRAGALGDRDRVAEVVAVAVRQQDRRRVELVRARGGSRVARQERVDEHGRPAVAQREGGVAQEAQLHLSPLPSKFSSPACAPARSRRPRRRACPAASPPRRACRSPAGARPRPRRRRRRSTACSCVSPNQPPAASASSSTRCSCGAARATSRCASRSRPSSFSAASAASSSASV